MIEPIEVPAALSGERVDRALALVTGLSRNDVAELVTEGRVLIDHKVVSQRHRKVREGELLEVVGEIELADETLHASSEVAFSVVYEDEAIIVVDKPAGLVVHPGAAHRDDTLAAGLLHRYPELEAAAERGAGSPERPGIVHRLDRDTSGLLVVARSPEAYEALSAQLVDRSMSRRYLSLALGHLDAEEGVIEAPIGRSRRDPTRMAVVVGGRDARTHYRVLRRFERPIRTTFVQLSLETGRTHQIRVHLRAIGHPVAGDSRYGGSARDVGLRRPFLHAAELELVHPLSGERRLFTSPLAPDLAAVIAHLESLGD